MTTGSSLPSERPASVRVLHVDDDPEFLDLTATFLERADARIAVETASRASDGLAQLTDEIDCIVSDYDMPGMTGLEFLETVREDHPDVPFILFTGKGSEEVAGDAISAGVTDYLQKRSESEQYDLLATRILNAVEKARAQTHRRRQLHAIETAREGIAFLDEEFTFTFVNDAYADLFGYEPAEMVDEPWDLVYPADAVAETKAEVSPALGREGYFRSETTFQRADGSTFLGDHIVSVTEGKEYVCLASDITERKERERALRERNNRLEALFEKAPDPIFVHDVTGTITDVNDAAIDTLGYSREELLSMTVTDIEVGPSPEELAAMWEDMETGSYERVDGTHQRADGSTFPVEVWISPVELDGAKRFIAIARDVTARQQRQRELRCLEEAVQTICANVPLVFFTLDADGVFTRSQGQALDRIGFDPGEVIGQSVSEVFADHPTFPDHCARALAGEHVTATVDVADSVFETWCQPLSEDGKVRGVVGIAYDITDQTLETVRERVERTLEATDSILFEIDLDSGQETRHGPFERLFGVPTERVPTSEAFYEKCVHPADRDRLRDLQRRESLTHEDGTIKYDFRTNPDRGTERWIHSELYALRDRNGTPQRLAGLNVDITDRKAREQKCQRAQQRFQTLYEHLSQPIVEVEYEGLDPIVVDVNSAFEDTFGYDADTLVGESLDAYIVPADRRAEAREINEHVIGGGQLVSREVTRQTADGPRDFLLENALYEDSSGGFAIYTDITDRKERERQLKERTEELEGLTTQLEEQYRHLFEEAPVMAVVTRAEEGRPVIDDCNQRFLETLGYEKEAVIDEELAEFYTPQGQRELLSEDGYERALGGELVRKDRKLVTADGETVETLMRAVPRQDAGADIVGTIGFFVDISERKDLERENARLEEFTRIVSHDLRSPLNVAHSYAELAREECDSEHLDDVMRTLERMGTLIEDLLTLAQSGQQIDEMDEIDLRTLVEDCWETVVTGEAAVTTEFEGASMVRGDRTRVQQLLENLFRNAIEHGGDDIAVTVGTIPGGFYVADDGPGIPPDDREKVFEASYTTSGDGAGFGLSIVKQVAEAHGWEIHVTEGSSGGARFEVTGVDLVSE